jgi:hypothetical protein
VIVLTILVKSSDQKDKSEIESTALGQGVGEALESIEQRLNDRIDKLEERVETRATQIEERIVDLKNNRD